MGTDALERENRELKRTLRLMARKAEDNKAILSSFFELELKLLGCNRFADLINVALVELRQHFRICSVSMLLLDPEHSARQLLDADQFEAYSPHLRFIDTTMLLNEMFPRRQMFVGELPASLRSRAFPHVEGNGSGALLPLIREDFLIGALYLYSNDPERYSDRFQYDYISHMASAVSICVENCINHENLRRISMVDMLTKVMNRRSFDQEITRELSRSMRDQKPLSCLFLDLDHFKKVNDTFGHLSGDQVLRTVGQLLKGSVRKTDLVARYGGEEFAILLPCCDADSAQQLAEGLRNKVQAMVFRSENGHPFRMSTSIGVSSCHAANLTDWTLADIVNELIRAADTAVYQAKHSGRNRVCVVPFPEHPHYGKVRA